MTRDDIDDETPPKRVCAYRADSREVGGCNFCDRHTTDRGVASHRVFEVSGNGLKVRFCQKCAREFAAAVGT